MATYFHGAPDIQSDGLQTLYLMNPNYAGYSETPNPSNMVFMNSLNQVNLSTTPPPSHHQQHLVGFPLHAAVSAEDQPSIHSPIDISAVHGLLPRLQYNIWTPTPSNNPIDMTSQLGFRRLPITPQAQQGLSLSLSPQQTSYASFRPEQETQAAPAITPAGGDDMRISGSSASVASTSNCIPNLQSILTGSKYLKVAQQLLDEVVNVGKGSKDESLKVSKTQTATNREKEAKIGEDSTARRGAELSTAERQEIQMKKAKLINMLDEVEQRYKQYHHQMHIVVQSFEAAAGFGSARTYTALALQTISKQFRCLRDTISGQIQATSKSLGEEDSLAGGTTKTEGSRLRFVDHQLRQQRALQQLGMIQHNAWRPQRGLPERSVSVLRAWLFEHFLHPYPKDSDKLMLAKQTGLTRSQVSNWFINARVRLWKPMVEEMYLEETKEQGQNPNTNCKSKSDPDEGSASKSTSPQVSSPTRTEQTDDAKRPALRIPSSASSKNVQMQDNYGDGELNLPENLKRARTDELLHPNTMPHSMNMIADLKPDDANIRDLFMKFGDVRQGSGDQEYSFVAGASASNNGSSFGAYPIEEIGRFDPEQFAQRFSGNGVSLTLGLPHCDTLSLSGAPRSYLSSESIPLGRRLDVSSEANEYCSLNNNSSPITHPSNGYHQDINIQTRKRFAAQLLRDFVA